MRTLDDLAVDGLQVRAAAAADFEVGDGTIRGRAVPYGTIVELLPGLYERFEPGAFSRQTRDPARVKLMFGHGEVIGHATALEERDDGLWIDGKIIDDADVPEGRKALALLRAKVVDELSVGFVQAKNGSVLTPYRDGTLVTHRRAALRECSIVAHGAYGRGAKVVNVRAEQAAADEARWKAEWAAKFAILQNR